MKATIEDNNGNTNVIEADSIIVIAGTRNGDKEKMETGMIGSMRDEFWRFVPNAVFNLAQMSIDESAIDADKKVKHKAARILALTENMLSVSKAKMNEIIEEAEPNEALAILATMALAFESGRSEDNGKDKSESLASILSGISDITS